MIYGGHFKIAAVHFLCIFGLGARRLKFRILVHHIPTSHYVKKKNWPRTPQTNLKEGGGGESTPPPRGPQN